LDDVIGKRKLRDFSVKANEEKSQKDISDRILNNKKAV